MSPEEKAKELFEKISWGLVPDGKSVRNAYIIQKAKQCALIAVNEIIEVAWWSGNAVDPLPDPYLHSSKDYWEAVRNHIENL